MTTSKKKTKRTTDKFPPDPVWPEYERWNDPEMANDVDRLLRQAWSQFESGQPTSRLLATLAFWTAHFMTGKIEGERVVSPERLRGYYTGTAADFALVQDKDGKPVARDDPRNAELRSAGPKAEK
jgi:hypothetical protein